MWSVEKINEWYDKKTPIIGFNYLPATAINSTEMWQDETFDAELINNELSIAKKYGFNSIRVFLQYLVYRNEKPLFLKNFEKFLEIANKNEMSVMPILFDDCAFSKKEPYLGPQQDPTPFVHNSGWTPSPGVKISEDALELPLLEEYIKDILTAYKDDQRIIIWDLYNEPGNSERKEKSLPLLRNVFKWARQVNPIQPLTSGIWIWEDYDLECINLSDIISYHDYVELSSSKQRLEQLKKHCRPLLITEWLHRVAGNTVETHLEYYLSENIGVYQWGLINGRTQAHLCWDETYNRSNLEPKIWQHDMLYSDFTLYSPDEMEYFTKIVSKAKI